MCDLWRFGVKSDPAEVHSAGSQWLMSDAMRANGDGASFLPPLLLQRLQGSARLRHRSLPIEAQKSGLKELAWEPVGWVVDRP